MRDYAAEYRTARVGFHDGTLGIVEASALARKIDRAAQCAGVDLDTVTLDEEARKIAATQS